MKGLWFECGSECGFDMGEQGQREAVVGLGNWQGCFKGALQYESAFVGRSSDLVAFKADCLLWELMLVSV